MSGAMDGTYAAFTGFWAAINVALTSRDLPEADLVEAQRLYRLAEDEQAAIMWRHLKGRFCTRACPQEGER